MAVGLLLSERQNWYTLSDEGKPASQQDNEADAERPHGGKVVVLFVKHFRSPIHRCASVTGELMANTVKVT